MAAVSLLLPVGGVVGAFALLPVHVPDVVRILLLKLVEAHDLREYTLVCFQPIHCCSEERRQEHADENQSMVNDEEDYVTLVSPIRTCLEGFHYYQMMNFPRHTA